MSIHSLLQDVPAVVWSGLLASLVTLAGVMVSNGSNTKRLLRQLDHDAEQKRRDRMAALYKEVYLEAAEELARASSYLGRISQLDPAKENVADGLAGFFAASAKAQLIAQPETSSLLGELTVQYGELLMRLMQHVMPVHDLNSEIRITTEFLDRNRIDAQRAVDEMRRAREAGALSQGRYEALEHSLKHATEMAESFSTHRDELWSKHAIANRDFNITLFAEMRKVGPTQTRALAALRSELGLETDLGGYAQRMEENWARLDRELGAVMSKLAGRDNAE